MIEIKKKSVIPVYGVAEAWVLYCIFFPLYKTWHFAALACTAALVFTALSALFRGKTLLVEVPEEPERTGDEKIDSLLADGERAVTELRTLQSSLQDKAVCQKLDEIITVIDKIFKKLLDSPGDYNQIRRFADFFLPTTIKLVHTYDRFGKSGAQGENITGTQERIDTALDTILESYKKFFDSLFMSQAIDIETDIRVLESMLKNEGLLGSGF